MKSSSSNSGSRIRSHSGQAMLIAVLTLGGAILGATTLAGLLMLYTIRSTTDSANSAKAIFAADAGVNWALYQYFDASTTLPTLPPGTTLTVTCSDDDDNAIPCDEAPTSTSAISEGIANGSRRAFFIELTGATGTLP